MIHKQNLKLIQNASYGAFGLGIIICMLSAAKMPASGQKWPDTLGIFFGGFALALLGIFGWRACVQFAVAHVPKARAQKGSRSSDSSGIQAGDPATLLSQALSEAKKLEKLSTQLKQTKVKKGNLELLALLETFSTQYLLPFEDFRARILHQHGMGKGSEFLAAIAYGERMFNRAISTAGDGAMGECRASIPEGVRALQLAQKILN